MPKLIATFESLDLQDDEASIEIPRRGQVWSVAGRVALVFAGLITIVWGGADFRAANRRLESARRFDNVKELVTAMRRTPDLSKAELEKRRKELIAQGASEKRAASHCSYLRWYFGGRIAFGAICILLLPVRFRANPVRITTSALGAHLSFTGSYGALNMMWPPGELEIEVCSGAQLIAIEAGIALLLAGAVYFAYRYAQTSHCWFDSIVVE